MLELTSINHTRKASTERWNCNEGIHNTFTIYNLQFFNDNFLLCTFYSTVSYGDVYYDKLSLLHNFIQQNLNSGSVQVRVLPAACRRFLMVGTSDSGLGWKYRLNVFSFHKNKTIHVSETLATSEEQRNTFVFDKKGEICAEWGNSFSLSCRRKLSLRVPLIFSYFSLTLCQSIHFPPFCILKLLRLSHSNWTISSVQIKIVSGDPLNNTFLFGVNFFNCVYLLFFSKSL